MNDEHADDRELLRQYLAGSEAAFRELVNRHLGTVQATVRRVLHSAPHLADDVTQVVFTDLAKKAATLSPQVVLAGWLHRHSYYLALNTARTEHRRRHRERTAMEINDVNASSLPAAHWLQLAPVLDDALDHLDTLDRDAIVLRYLQQQNLRSVGLAIGLNEDAAQKRVARALDKLRDILVQRGVTLTGVLLATELEAGAGPVAASPALAASISAHALSAAASTTGFFLTYLIAMTTNKIIALGIVAIIILCGLSIFCVRNKMAPSSANTRVVSLASTDKPLSTPIKVAQVEAPKLAPVPAGGAANILSTPDDGSIIWSKLETIVVPSMNIDVPIPLDEVARTLQVISKAFDPENKGVKIVVIPGNSPLPKITLQNQKGLSMHDLLEKACQSSGYTLSIENNVIMLRPNGPI